MTDREILKWFHLNDAQARRRVGDLSPHFCFLTEGARSGHKKVWLVYRAAGEVHLRVVRPEVLNSFRASVMRGYQQREAVPQVTDAQIDPKAVRKKFPVPPTPDTQSERIKFYWMPPSERARQDPWTPEFYLLARGNGLFYLGHRNHYEFYLRQIAKDFYEALKRDILWRWKQVGIEHLVGQTLVDHPDEAMLLDDPGTASSTPSPGTSPSSRPPPAPQPKPKTPPVPLSGPPWAWRNRFGPLFPRKEE